MIRLNKTLVVSPHPYPWITYRLGTTVWRLGESGGISYFEFGAVATPLTLL